MATKERGRCRLFLSHAARDKALVEAFETLLAKSMGLTSADIFCSSLEGQGVPKGGDFVAGIRAKAEAADAVIALITPAYLDSAFCMAELGAAWVLETNRLPVVVPPNTFRVMEATLLGIVGVRIDDNDALAQAFEELAEAIGVAPPAVGVRQRAMREFERAWNELKDKIQPSNRVEAAVHADLMRKLDEALKARDAAEEELSKADAKILALRKAKDAATVAKIDEEFDPSGWQQQIDEAFDNIRDLYDEIGGKEIARLVILDHIGSFVRPDYNTHPEEASRAVELGIYDEENYRWDYGNPEIRALIKNVDKIIDIIDEEPEAAKHFDAGKSKGNPRKIRFWENHL